MFGTKIIAADSLSSESCDVGPPEIRIIGLEQRGSLRLRVEEFIGQANTSNSFVCTSNHPKPFFQASLATADPLLDMTTRASLHPLLYMHQRVLAITRQRLTTAPSLDHS